MQLEPKDLYEKVEFDKVIELLQKECLGELGKVAIQNLPIHTNSDKIRLLLLEVSEYKLSIEENDHFPMTAYEDLEEDLKHLAVEGSVLTTEGLQRINTILRSLQAIFKFFKKTRQEIYPQLYLIIRDVVFDEELIKAIESVIDEEGNIRPDASPELLKISKGIASKNKELDKVFRSVINKYRNQGWLSDNVESIRNGRRVLSVPSEHKRKIRGIIHDESTTGKTAFIEPEPIIEINNDIFDLETEQRREIYRILKTLSATLRPYVSLLRTYQAVMIRYDIIQSKARLAVKMNAFQPKLKKHPHFGILNAFHPLLFLKNKEINKKTVPFDLVFHGKNRILVLSGPNAGGKSVTMKTVGLIQLMLQAGMLIPVHPESEIGVFKKMFADIGDQQSLEDDLSTYSSRLNNMKTFIDAADRDTLVLIDEFGSGTDPKIGGAIAEAILKELNQRKVFGVITTHYSNLKIFAFNTFGIVNGSMTFDKDNLTPTYEMRVGRPGSSYAFEIAKKTGLNKKVLSYARHKTGKNEKAVDQLLIDLQKEKQELEEQLQKMQDREKKLERLIKNYENLHKDLEFKRKKIKLQSKEQELQQVARENKKFEKLIREIKEEKNLEKAKKLAATVRAQRSELVDSVDELREKVYYEPTEAKAKDAQIKVGDYVKLRTGGATGTVESINKGKVIVLMGLMKMTAKLKDLIPAKQPLDIVDSKRVKTDTIETSIKFESKMDIRGLTKSEALRLMESFLDKALMSNATHVRILHGKGTGVLRNAVRTKLREYKDSIAEIYHPPREQGGDGITVVQFE
ncbi:MAG: Smr/MutS family protein [Bacteroidota bacterium]